MKQRSEVTDGRLSSGQVRPPVSVLPQVQAFMEAFERVGVHYCHWKSNEHLASGLQGNTDLDLLIDRRHQAAAARVLLDVGYKRFQSVAPATYPAIEDYLAVDVGSGKLSHLHIHYRLTLGERFLKGYRLPWEDRLLEGRIREPRHGVFTVEPELELLVLVVRAALKLRLRDHVLRASSLHRIDDNDITEFSWLHDRADLAGVEGLTAELLDPRSSAIMAEILERGLTTRRLFRFRSASKGILNEYRYYPPIQGRILRWLREASLLTRHLARRLGVETVPARRVLPNGGMVVAFLGADGAGKSTQVGRVADTFSKKIDVATVYFGSGDGQASPIRWLALTARKMLIRLGWSPGNQRRSSSQGSTGIGLARLAWALVVALEKRKKLSQAHCASGRGMLVLTDRYPQNQVLGYNDGPLLSTWRGSENVLKRSLARWEGRVYDRAAARQPDLVFKLKVPTQVARARKQDTPEAMIQAKIKAVEALAFSPSTHVEVVDATGSPEHVTAVILNSLWQGL